MSSYSVNGAAFSEIYAVIIIPYYYIPSFNSKVVCKGGTTHITQAYVNLFSSTMYCK